MVSGILIYGCGAGYDHEKCLENVKIKYPNSKIINSFQNENIEWKWFYYLVMTESNEVRLVICGSQFHPVITIDELLFPSQEVKKNIQNTKNKDEEISDLKKLISELSNEVKNRPKSKSILEE